MDYLMPAEWTPHQRCWIAWPCRESLWHTAAGLDAARHAYAQVARAIAAFEPVTMIARPEDAAMARQLCGDGVQVAPYPLDDSWMRDIGPSFVRRSDGALAGVCWRFNGWGGKYRPFEHDAALATALLDDLGIARLETPLIMEGGAIHVDGRGTMIATEQCLLNPNRAAGLSRAGIEAEFSRLLGIKQVIWLGEGLSGDETDGHVDNLCCFAGEGRLLLQGCADRADPNFAIAADALARLKAARDCDGGSFEIGILPMPAPRHDVAGARLILSYVNFYIANGAVIVPAFDDPADEPARAMIGACFPGRQVVQLPALDIVAGGGGIHCITQQMPALSLP